MPGEFMTSTHAARRGGCEGARTPGRAHRVAGARSRSRRPRCSAACRRSYGRRALRARRGCAAAAPGARRHLHLGSSCRRQRPRPAGSGSRVWPMRMVSEGRRRGVPLAASISCKNPVRQCTKPLRRSQAHGARPEPSLGRPLIGAAAALPREAVVQRMLEALNEHGYDLTPGRAGRDEYPGPGWQAHRARAGAPARPSRQSMNLPACRAWRRARLPGRPTATGAWRAWLSSPSAGAPRSAS